MRGTIYTTPVARSVPFDKTPTSLSSTDVQGAIEELDHRVGTSASPGFTWGRSGNINANSWLLNDTVPSNLAGRTCPLATALIRTILIANEDANTFTVGIYEHDGVTYTQLTTVVLTAQRSKIVGVSVSVTQNKELAVKLESGSAKNLVVGLVLSGTLP